MTKKQPNDAVEAQDETLISKSQIKREAEALQELGLKLVKLTDNQLSGIPMDDELSQAIMLARRIQKKHEAFRRQMQFIGKLMRQRDVTPIQEAYDQLQGFHRKTTDHFHQIEQWRADILAKGSVAVDEFITVYPTADREKLLNWVSEHEYQQQHSKPPMASRQLFVYLRELMN